MSFNVGDKVEIITRGYWHTDMEGHVVKLGVGGRNRQPVKVIIKGKNEVSGGWYDEADLKLVEAYVPSPWLDTLLEKWAAFPPGDLVS